MVYKVVILIFKIYFFFLLNIKVNGRENIPSGGAAILVANHPSLIDAPLLAAVISRKLYPFAKTEVFNTRSKRWFLKRMGGIPVKGGKFARAFVMETENKLNDNNLLLIFPEGKTSENNELDKFDLGFMKIAQKYNVPIIPISIRGTEKVLSKNDKFPGPADVTVTISFPIKSQKDKMNIDGIEDEVEFIKEIIYTN